eukprot:54643_1
MTFSACYGNTNYVEMPPEKEPARSQPPVDQRSVELDFVGNEWSRTPIYPTFTKIPESFQYEPSAPPEEEAYDGGLSAPLLRAFTPPPSYSPPLTTKPTVRRSHSLEPQARRRVQTPNSSDWKYNLPSELRRSAAKVKRAQASVGTRPPAPPAVTAGSGPGTNVDLMYGEPKSADNIMYQETSHSHNHEVSSDHMYSDSQKDLYADVDHSLYNTNSMSDPYKTAYSDALT